MSPARSHSVDRMGIVPSTLPVVVIIEFSTPSSTGVAMICRIVLQTTRSCHDGQSLSASSRVEFSGLPL